MKTRIASALAAFAFFATPVSTNAVTGADILKRGENQLAALSDNDILAECSVAVANSNPELMAKPLNFNLRTGPNDIVALEGASATFLTALHGDKAYSAKYVGPSEQANLNAIVTRVFTTRPTGNTLELTLNPFGNKDQVIFHRSAKGEYTFGATITTEQQTALRAYGDATHNALQAFFPTCVQALTSVRAHVQSRTPRP